MLSFKELTEKKTKVTINPKLDQLKEKKCDKCGEESCECDAKKKKCPECNGKGCKHCGGTGYHTEGEGEMSEAKKDPTYLETDFKKRQKNNEKARKEMEKIPGQKNPHFEAKSYDPMEDPDFDHDEAERTRGQSGKNKSITVKKKTKKEEFAYVSQEEVSEESDQSIEKEETSLLTFGDFTEGLTDLQRRRYLGRREGESKERLKRINDRKVKKAALASLEKHAKGMKAGIYDSYEAESELVDEATRAAKEGKKDEHRVGVDIRAKQSATTLAAKRARQKVLDDYEKKTGKKLDISKSPEGKTHAKHFGGSRQTKKVKGEKETPAETHNRRVGKNVARIVKHGYTSKEKKEVKGMAKHASRYD